MIASLHVLASVVLILFFPFASAEGSCEDTQSYISQYCDCAWYQERNCKPEYYNGEGGNFAQEKNQTCKDCCCIGQYVGAVNETQVSMAPSMVTVLVKDKEASTKILGTVPSAPTPSAVATAPTNPSVKTRNTTLSSNTTAPSSMSVAPSSMSVKSLAPVKSSMSVAPSSMSVKSLAPVKAPNATLSSNTTAPTSISVKSIAPVAPSVAPIDEVVDVGPYIVHPQVKSKPKPKSKAKSKPKHQSKSKSKPKPKPKPKMESKVGDVYVTHTHSAKVGSSGPVLPPTSRVNSYSPVIYTPGVSAATSSVNTTEQSAVPNRSGLSGVVIRFGLVTMAILAIAFVVQKKMRQKPHDPNNIKKRRYRRRIVDDGDGDTDTDDAVTYYRVS